MKYLDFAMFASFNGRIFPLIIELYGHVKHEDNPIFTPQTAHELAVFALFIIHQNGTVVPDHFENNNPVWIIDDSDLLDSFLNELQQNDVELNQHKITTVSARIWQNHLCVKIVLRPQIDLHYDDDILIIANFIPALTN